MQFTKHAQDRMNQRGIPARLVAMVRKYGRDDGRRWVLDRREVDRVLEALDDDRRLLIKIRDKGGIGVPNDGDTVITVYNLHRK